MPFSLRYHDLAPPRGRLPLGFSARIAGRHLSPAADATTSQTLKGQAHVPEETIERLKREWAGEAKVVPMKKQKGTKGR
jgi:hypothetical protein